MNQRQWALGQGGRDPVEGGGHRLVLAGGQADARLRLQVPLAKMLQLPAQQRRVATPPECHAAGIAPGGTQLLQADDVLHGQPVQALARGRRAGLDRHLERSVAQILQRQQPQAGVIAVDARNRQPAAVQVALHIQKWQLGRLSLAAPLV